MSTVRIMQPGESVSPNTLIAIDARPELDFGDLGRLPGHEEFGAIWRYGVLLNHPWVGSELAARIATIVGSNRFQLGVYLDEDQEPITFTADTLGSGSAQAVGAAIGQNVHFVANTAGTIVNSGLRAAGAPDIPEIWSTAKMVGLALFILLALLLYRGGSVKAGGIGLSG